MLFGSQQMQRTWRERIARTIRRLQREGVPPLGIVNEIRVLIGGLVGTGAVSGVTISNLYRFASTYIANPTSQQTPSTLSKRLRGTQDTVEGERPSKRKGLLQPKRLRFESMSEATVDASGDSSMAASKSAMVSSSGRGNAHETPVDNPYVVYRGPPDYTFASLPWAFDSNEVRSNYYALDNTFRMTSPYDCLTGVNLYDYNTGAGTLNVKEQDTDANDATASKARWWDYYAGLYKYYHVVSCQYNIFVENLSGEPVWAYAIFHNDTSPPILADNQDIQYWRDVKYHYLETFYRPVLSGGWAETGGYMVDNAENIVSGNNTSADDQFEAGENVGINGKRSCLFQGEYRPGDFKREIRLDSEVENWTLTSTNPTLTERLTIRVKPYNDAQNTNSASTFGDDVKLRIRVKLNYLCEFKELKDGLRWPVQRQPLTVTIAQSTTTA